jgi:hypothetical protein
MTIIMITMRTKTATPIPTPIPISFPVEAEDLAASVVVITGNIDKND